MPLSFDSIPFHQQLVLCMPFHEGAGTELHDLSTQHILGDMSAAPPNWSALASGLPILDFVPTDYVIIPAAYTILNFTTQDFSLGAWVNIDSLASNRYIYCRGLSSVDGYFMAITTAGKWSFATCQAGAGQVSQSADGAFVTGTWYYLGVSRTGTSVRLYRNAVDITSIVGSHTNPLTSARSAKIGAYDDLLYPMDGKMGPLMVWRNKALSQAEHLAVFDYWKWWFGL